MIRKYKILLGTPTYDGKEYCLDYWIKIIKEIQKTTPCDVLLVDNSKGNNYFNLIKRHKLNVIKSPNYKNPLKSLGEARKKLYEYAIKENYDFLFSLEQDIFPPKDIISNLLKIRGKINNESVIGVPYKIGNITWEKSPYLGKDELTNIATGRIYVKYLKRTIQKNLTKKQIKKKKKIMKVYACGFGCTLIDVSILKKIKVRYTEENPKFKGEFKYRPDDGLFFVDLHNLRINTYADPNLIGKIIHIYGDCKKQTSWKVKRLKKKK